MGQPFINYNTYLRENRFQTHPSIKIISTQWGGLLPA